ncbi:MAG: tetratricopeptide repeat protein [Planctomycetes bacterium]|nr:tetratricopeptide repeat protein [Planctomycetota bacterium]
MQRTSVVVAACVWAAWPLTGCGIFRDAPQEDAQDEAVLTEIEAPDPAEPAQTYQQRLLADADAAKDAGEYEAALALFIEILADNPTLTTAYLGIGDIYLLQKNYAGAEPAFARAARLGPRNFDAQYGHALALQMLNRFVEAVKAYRRALTIRPESVRANLNLATTYLQMGEPRPALIFAEKVVELDPANGPARANLGAVYEQIERYGDAVMQYESAVELMEPTPPLLMNLINVLAKESLYLEAKNTAEFLVKLQPSANALERLGWSNFRLGEYDKSIDAYRMAVQLDPGHWPSLNGVGVNALNAWLLSNKRDVRAAREAKRALQRSLQANADQPKIVRLLSQYQL